MFLYLEENQDQGVSERDKTVSIQSIVSSFVGVTDSRQIKKDRDHSKLIKSINHRSIVVNARGVLGEKSAFSPSMHLCSCHAFALYFYFF